MKRINQQIRKALIIFIKKNPYTWRKLLCLEINRTFQINMTYNELIEFIRDEHIFKKSRYNEKLKPVTMREAFKGEKDLLVRLPRSR